MDDHFRIAGSEFFQSGPRPRLKHGSERPVSSLMLVHMAVSALRRPRLVVPLIRAAWRFRVRGWYRRPPFLPLPSRDYLEWRLHTAYGGADRLPEPCELERYLRWAAWMRRHP